MKRLAARAGLLALGFLLAAAVIAQQTVDRNPNPASMTAEEMLAKLKEKDEGTSAAPDAGAPYLPKVWCGEISDEPTKDVCWKAYRASLDYYETGLTHRTKVFEWQHTSTILIFWVVVTLVGAGLFFAWLQFRAALRPRPSKPSSPDAPDVKGTVEMVVTAASGVSTVEIGKDGFKVSSPVLGVIILALSLAFFYLYLVYAYPISELF